MSHIRVLIAHKDENVYKVINRNCTRTTDMGDGNEFEAYPFGYDYLVPESKPMKVKDALKDQVFIDKYGWDEESWWFGMIIQEDEILYDYDGCKAKYTESEAMAMLNPEYYCTVCDGHL